MKLSIILPISLTLIMMAPSSFCQLGEIIQTLIPAVVGSIQQKGANFALVTKLIQLVYIVGKHPTKFVMQDGADVEQLIIGISDDIPAMVDLAKSKIVEIGTHVGARREIVAEAQRVLSDVETCGQPDTLRFAKIARELIELAAAKAAEDKAAGRISEPEEKEGIVEALHHVMSIFTGATTGPGLGSATGGATETSTGAESGHSNSEPDHGDFAKNIMGMFLNHGQGDGADNGTTDDKNEAPKGMEGGFENKAHGGGDVMGGIMGNLLGSILGGNSGDSGTTGQSTGHVVGKFMQGVFSGIGSIIEGAAKKKKHLSDADADTPPELKEKGDLESTNSSNETGSTPTKDHGSTVRLTSKSSASTDQSSAKEDKETKSQSSKTTEVNVPSIAQADQSSSVKEEKSLKVQPDKEGSPSGDASASTAVPAVKIAA